MISSLYSLPAAQQQPLVKEKNEDIWEMTRRIFQEALYCPFESKKNPYADIAQNHVDNWVKDKNLLPSEKHYHYFSAYKCSYLAAMSHSSCSLDRLILAAKWDSWLFLYDDRCEKIKDTQILSEYSAHNLCVLEGTVKPQDDPLSQALFELREETFPMGTPVWFQYFCKIVGQHFRSLLSEKKGVIGLNEYIEARRHTGAVYVVLALMMLIEDITLPMEIIEHAHIQMLNLVSNDIICWSNDIVSLPKEIRDNEESNIVIILTQEQNLPTQTATQAVVDMHNRKVEHFLMLKQDLSNFGEHHGMVVKYIKGLEAWIRANFDWSLITERYKQPPTSQSHL